MCWGIVLTQDKPTNKGNSLPSAQKVKWVERTHTSSPSYICLTPKTSGLISCLLTLRCFPGSPQGIRNLHFHNSTGTRPCLESPTHHAWLQALDTCLNLCNTQPPKRQAFPLFYKDENTAPQREKTQRNPQSLRKDEQQSSTLTQSLTLGTLNNSSEQ